MLTIHLRDFSCSITNIAFETPKAFRNYEFMNLLNELILKLSSILFHLPKIIR